MKKNNKKYLCNYFNFYMKKYNQVKVIDEENEEELNEDTKEEQGQNDFFIKDQEPNELRKID